MSSIRSPHGPGVVLEIPPVPTIPPEPGAPPEPIFPPVPMIPPEPMTPPEPVIPPVLTAGASGWMLASGVVVQAPPVLARHRPFEQQPSLQVLLAQQTSPSPPQREHTPSPLVVLQALPALQRSRPLPVGQHVSPALPHEVHVPLLQRRPS